jgi:hypothetical protein
MLRRSEFWIDRAVALKDLGGFALLDLYRPSHRFLGGFLVAHELDAAVIKDGHPTASDVKIIASHWKPRRERRLANDVALMLGVLARRKWGIARTLRSGA